LQIDEQKSIVGGVPPPMTFSWLDVPACRRDTAGVGGGRRPVRGVFLRILFLLLPLLAAVEVVHAAKKKILPGICSDYFSRTNITGQPYYFREAETGRIQRRHIGIDFCAKPGTPLLAVADGVVERIEQDHPDAGGVIVLKSYITFKTDEPQAPLETVFFLNAHVVPAPDLKVGYFVTAGDVIGSVRKGDRPAYSIPHVHLTASYCSRDLTRCHINPHAFWAKGKGKVTCFDPKDPPPKDRIVAPIPCWKQ
jgi:murein DD-endopeptidase MepM/ murein hydrolase activator NlpD